MSGMVLEWQDRTEELINDDMVADQFRLEFAADGTVRAANQVAQTLMAQDGKDIVGQDLGANGRFLAANGEVKKLEELAQAGQRTTGRFQIDLPHGSVFADGTFMPVRGQDGQVSRILLQATDCTQDHMRQEAAKEENARGQRVQKNVVETLGSVLQKLAAYDLTAQIDCDLGQEYETVKSNFNSAMRTLNETVAKPGSGVGEYINRTMEDDKLLGERVWRLICIVYAVTSYFTIRERTNPVYFGMDLDSDETWDFLIKTVDDLVDVYLRD